MVDANATAHCSRGKREKFFLVKGEDAGAADAQVAGVPDGVGVLHIDLCVRKGKAWLRKLWYDGASCDDDSRRYAVAVHNGRFGDPLGSAEDSEDCSPVCSPVGSSLKKRVRCLSSGSDDDDDGGGGGRPVANVTASECIRRSARRRVPFGDAVVDPSSCPDGADPAAAIVDCRSGVTARDEDDDDDDDDDDGRGRMNVRRSRRITEKRRQKSSPLAERLIKRSRETVVVCPGDDAGRDEGLVGTAAADGMPASCSKLLRSGGPIDVDESDGSDSSEPPPSDFLVDSSSVESDDGPPPRNPYMPSKEELDESHKPAFTQLRTVTNRNRSQFDSFRYYMKGMLRRACEERSGHVKKLLEASSTTTDEEKAARKIRDDMINSMKNNLSSAAWQKEFKDALDTYETYRSEKVAYDGHTCQACHRKERRATYVIRLSDPAAAALGGSCHRRGGGGRSSAAEDAEPKPPLVAVYAGRRCANRSQGYHELQHYEKAALSSCRARVKAVARRAGQGLRLAATPEQCLAGEDGEEWLSLEFSLLQSQLQAAEKFMDTGDADNDD